MNLLTAKVNFRIGLSAFLTLLCFPFACYTSNLIPGGLSASVVWFSLVPVLTLLENQTPRQAFKIGYIFGFLANLGIFFWVIIAMQKYGNMSVWISLLILLTKVATLAFYPAMAFYAVRKWENLAPVWFLGTVVFTLLEWSRNYFPVGGYPWANPAYALYDFLHVIQVIDITGIQGVTFLVLLSNFILADYFLRRRPLGGTILFVALFTLFLGYGSHSISSRTSKLESSKTSPIKVSLLQGNIPQNHKWNRSMEISILSIYRELTAKAETEGPQLIVWPEAAWPMTLSRNTAHVPFMRGVSQAQTIIGSPAWAMEGGKQMFFNSAFVIDSKGTVVHRYDKQHLVPFGEYVPLSKYLPMHYIVPSVAGNFVEGSPVATLPELKHQDNSWKYSILICYEMLFPELSVQSVRQGASFLVNITNDAWFDATSGPYQHAHYGIFRAIETRRPIVRAANTGVTLWYDTLGARHQATELFTQQLVQASIIPETDLTFYVRYPWATTALLFLLLFAIAGGLFKKYAK